MALLRIAKDPNSNNGGGYTPAPEGTYEVTVESFEIRTAKNENKTQCLSLKCQVLNGPARVGKTVYIPVWLSQKSVWKVEEACNAAGVDFEIEETTTATGVSEEILFDPSHFVGTAFKAQCEHEMYKDKPQERWTKLSPLAEQSLPAAPVVQQLAPQPAATVATAAATVGAEVAAVGTVTRRRRVAS